MYLLIYKNLQFSFLSIMNYELSIMNYEL